MGNGRRFEARKQRLFPRPLPIIGVRRVIMQCRAHDDDRAAPAVAPGPEIPMASAFQPATPEQGCFFRGRSIGGLVELLARNPCAIGIQPVHTRVDSLWTPAKGDSTKSDFALALGVGGNGRGERVERCAVSLAGFFLRHRRADEAHRQAAHHAFAVADRHPDALQAAAARQHGKE